MHHTPPARARGKMQKILRSGPQRSKKISPGVICWSSFYGPVNHHRPAHHGAAIHKTPIAAVPTAIAIISHHEIIIRWNDQLSVVDVAENLFRPFRANSDFREIAARGRKIIAKRIFISCIVDHIWFVEEIVIHINMLVNDAHAVAGQADHTLHVMRVIIERKFEDDDIAAPDWTVGKDFFVPRALASKDKFVYQQMIAD